VASTFGTWSTLEVMLGGSTITTSNCSAGSSAGSHSKTSASIQVCLAGSIVWWASPSSSAASEASTWVIAAAPARSQARPRPPVYENRSRTRAPASSRPASSRRRPRRSRKVPLFCPADGLAIRVRVSSRKWTRSGSSVPRRRRGRSPPPRARVGGFSTIVVAPTARAIRAAAQRASPRMPGW